MKRFISFIIFASLLLSLCMFPVADTTGSKQLTSTTNAKTMEVSYTCAESYIVAIPAVVDLNKASSVDVSVSDLMLEEGNQVSVSVASENGYKLKKGNNEIPYTVTPDGMNALTGTTATTILKTNAAKTVALAFALAQTEQNNATQAGEYSDTLTFTVSVGKAAITFCVDGQPYSFSPDGDKTWKAFVKTDVAQNAQITVTPDNVLLNDQPVINAEGSYVHPSTEIEDGGEYTTNSDE